MTRIAIFLILTHQWILAECLSDIVIMSHTPVVRDAELTTLVCKDLSGTSSRGSYEIRRQFQWGGSTTTKASSSGLAWNDTAVSERWRGKDTGNAIGGFGCGSGDDAVSVVKMHLNSSLVPDKFSMTSSVGNKVVIELKSQLQNEDNKITWYKNGHILSFRAESARIWKVNNGKSLVISSLKKEDAGIYMARYVNEADKYAAGTILNVRDCPLNKWSVNCSKTCPVCRNGGICDERSGDCTCMPGFHGDRCDVACPPSTFGRQCENHCKDIGIAGRTCRGIEHCSVTGCYCFNGWTGLDCTEACPAGFYGAGCDLRCSCQNGGRCDRFFGCDCTGPSCEFTDSGRNRSDTGTRQPAISVACDPSKVNGCEERAPVITSITASPSWMVYVKQIVTINCSVTGNPAPGHGGISIESNSGHEIKLVSTKMSDLYTTTSHFEHVMTLYDGPFWCVAKTSAGQARKEFNFTIPVKPLPLRPPELIRKSTDYLEIKLNSEKYHGDGPIVTTQLLYKKTNDTKPYKFIGGKFVNDTVVLRDLEAYTDYTFRVLLERPGPNGRGLGHPGPETVIKTFCKYPLKPPTIKSIYPKNDTILYIAWSLPPKEDIRGEVLGYKIRYKLLGDKSSWIPIDLAYRSKTSTTLDNMKPLAVYSVKILLYNCAGNGVESEPVRVTMGRLETPAGPDASIVNRTSRTAGFEWLAPSNAKPYTISDYEVSLKEVGSDGHTLLANYSSPGLVAQNLTPFTDYVFKVRAFNHEGPGNYSDEIYFKTEEEAPSVPSNFRVTRITTSSVELAWEQPEEPNGVIRRYILKYTSEGEVWTTVTVGKSTKYIVENLQEYHGYEFKVQAVTVSPGNWTRSIFQKTMTSSPLLPPSNVEFTSKSPKSVLVRWNPPPPSEYVHEIRRYKISYTDDMRQNIEHWNSKFVDGRQLNLTVDQLRPSTVYLFAIAAVTLKAGKFGERRTFRTNSLTIPPSPNNVRFLNVTARSALIKWNVASGYDVSNVRMRWKSMTSTDWRVLHFTSGVYTISLNTLQPETYYNIELIAFNSKGQSIPMTTHFQTTKEEKRLSNSQIPIFAWVIAGVIGSLVLVVIVASIYCLRKRSRKRRRDPVDNYYSHEMTVRGKIQRQSTIGSSFNAGGINQRSNTLLSSHSAHSVNSKTASNCEVAVTIPQQMILSWESIFFEDITLGEGNFGQVVKAIVQIEDKCIDAAVKMLKDGCSMDDRKDFLAELDMMVRFGKHPNIISLIGACEHNSNLYLCTEFAPNGNLLQYLRKSRNTGGEATYTYLTQGQLLQFALDICQGMSFLSDQELIHRDLAARNILLSANLTCKVADFGLSRGEGVYVKRTVARLPIRWMAIESLNYNVYTTQSDVWSFGVVLWEIVSLGGTPYYGMSCAELYEKLPKGYRMEQPLNCDAEIYKLMCQCWKDRPHERPSFPQLSVALRRMIDERTDVNYVNTALFENFSFFKIDANEEEED